MISTESISLNLDQALALILNTFVFSIPVYITYHSSMDLKKKNSSISLFFISVLLLFFFKNPFLVKRNALGPIYLTLCFIIFKNSFNNFRMFLSLIFVLSIIFPFSQAFTHSNRVVIGNLFQTFLNRIKNMDINYALTSLDYDASSNFMAAIKYSEIESIT